MAVETLAIGPWSARVQDGILRRLMRGEVEVLRGAGPTIRDAEWATIAPSRVETDRFGDAALSCTARFRSGGLAVEVITRYGLAGDALEISSTACMLAHTSAQRIGMSVLFPLTVSGRGWSATGDAGLRIGRFPDEISVLPVVSGVRRLEWELPDDGHAALEFDGSTWDVEDQRNWSDASFKGYSPSLTNEQPWEYEAGTSLHTRLTLTVDARPRRARRPSDRPSTASIDVATSHPLPPVGCVLTGGTREQLDRLVEMAPAFLRVPLEVTDSYWVDRLVAALALSRRAGAQLVIEALFPAGDHGSAAALADALTDDHDRILDVLVFDTGDGSAAVTAAGQVGIARNEFRRRGISTPVGGGTRANYRELATAAPTLDGIDVISLAIAPTVHALDDDTVLENLETLPLLTRSARQLVPSALLDVAVAMRPRVNPYVRSPSAAPDPDRFDPRLHSEFGAAWLVGVIDRMGSALPDRLTLLEAAGSAGWVDGPRSPVSEVLGLLAAGGSIHPCSSRDGIACVALSRGGRMSVLVATTRDEPTAVDVDAPGVISGHVRLPARSAAILSGTIPS